MGWRHQARGRSGPDLLQIGSRTGSGSGGLVGGQRTGAIEKWARKRFVYLVDAITC